MFPTKDLLIYRPRGERHFMRQLVDGDLACNNGGWQWCAGTGTDAAPYFRIFSGPAGQDVRSKRGVCPPMGAGTGVIAGQLDS
jgi:deoxyribodipyrimidine photo-lyase